MKTLFIEAKARINVNRLIDKIKFPERVALVSSVQFLENLQDIKVYLEKKGKKVYIAGQVLGCNVVNTLKFADKIDAFLFIGSRGFHPVEIARITKKLVIVLNPITNEISQIKKDEVESIEKKKKGSLLRYLNSKKVGILVTIKPGQENIALAKLLKEKIKDKETYLFVGNELTENDLINFSGIESWINTACSRIEINRVVNFEEIANYINKSLSLKGE
ncbi:MAG: diphthamide synthesis protein [Nanoarchaeota archaeon]